MTRTNGSDWPPKIPPFHPPWWLASGHAQTLAAACWPARLPRYRATARRVELDDGDAVIVHDDCPAGWHPGGLAALLMHGLSGCHLSPLLVRMTEKLTARGVRVFRFDMRCCGAGLGLARRPYHAGRSDDLAQVVASVVDWCAAGAEFSPRSSSTGGRSAVGVPGNARPPVEDDQGLSLALIGVSLSGNILLKYLGEDPDRVPAAVARAVAVNPPIDLTRCIANMDGPINRLYDRHFVGSLVRQVQRHRRLLPDAPGPIGRLSSRRLHDFDEWFTAPVSGFPNAATYYQRSSAAQFMPQIRVPTLVVTARDDPMVPVAMFEERHADWPANVHLAIASGGGHVGYFARRGLDPDPHWLEWRVVDLVTRAGNAVAVSA